MPRNKPETASSAAPLSEPALYLLLALAEEDLHGWGILKQVERASSGRLRLSAGTLYGLLRRLSDQGLLEESDERPPARWDDSRRRYYRLSDHGRDVLRSELERLESLLDLARGLELGPAAS